MPPTTTAGTAPISAAATPDSNAPSSFDALMKTISTAVTRPRNSSGVTSGRIVERRTTLTVSNADPSASASMESHIVRERPKTIMQTPNPATTTNNFGPACLWIGYRAMNRRAQERAHRGSRAEEAEPRRADLEDVLREDRQKRHRAAEQHREEIERDRAEENVRPPDQSHAGEHLAETGRATRHRKPAAPHRERHSPAPRARAAIATM